MALLKRLTEFGIRNADAVLRAATDTGVPLHIAAAMVEKESNGLNVYGNDHGGVFSTGDPARPDPNVVTAANYREFERRVLAGETSNGVGPAQITWPGFIRDAKARGIRLWEPLPNIVYGLTLLGDYLAGDFSDDSIIRAGTRYNGARAYGVDLADKARVWRGRLGGDMALLRFPAASRAQTNGFWVALEAIFNQMGYDVYCAPSYVHRGWCAPGKHGHGRWSRHWDARALDIGYDPPWGAPESDYEKSFLDPAIRMLEARYGLNIFLVWNRGPGDHRDHGHLDDQRGYRREGVYTNIKMPDGIQGFGYSGGKVRELQEGLNRKGSRLTVDGIFGLRTFDALREFQYGAGLVPDGLAGPATFDALAEREDPNKGLTRKEVKRAQHLLNEVCDAGLAVDGVLGAATDAATRAYQSEHGLEVDGIPGRITRTHLEDTLSAIKDLTEEVKAVRREVAGLDQKVSRLTLAKIAEAVWGYMLYGFRAHWWLRRGSLGKRTDHANFPADPGSPADIERRVAEATLHEQVEPYTG